MIPFPPKEHANEKTHRRLLADAINWVLQWFTSSGTATNNQYMGSDGNGGVEFKQVDWSDLSDTTGNKPEDGATRNNFRGDWVTATNYFVGDLVMAADYGWICILNHTSSGTNTPPTYPTSSNTWWSIYTIKGDQGPPGADGADGVDGSGVTIQGTDTYANIIAIASPSAGDMWIASDTTANADAGDGIVFNGSSWSNVGPVRGPTGDTGLSAYVHYAYATSSNGTTGFSLTYTGVEEYVGVLTDNTVADSTTPGDYEWSRFKGDAGIAVVITPNREQSFTSTDTVLDAGQSDIVFTATVDNIETPSFVWSQSGCQNAPTASTSSTYTVTAANFGTAKSAIITCTVDGTYVNKTTIVRLETSTAEAGATAGATWGANIADQPSDANIYNGNAVSGLSTLLPNWNLSIVDSDGNPAGLYPVEGITDFSGITSGVDGDDTYIRLSHASDGTVAYGFPAIEIDDTATYKVSIRHRASSTATGLYLRMNELAGIPTGSYTHIGYPSFGKTVQRTGIRVFESSAAFPGATWELDEYIYTPTAGTKTASFSFYNWAATTVDYDIERVMITRLPGEAQKNANVSINANGTLSGAGTGQVTLSGLGYNGDLNATQNNITYSASAPVSPVDGDIWIDTSTSPDTTKVRVGGVWQIGATLGATWNSNIQGQPSDADISNAQITVSANGTLNNAGGGQVTIGGLGFTGDLAATKNIVTYSASAPSSPTDGDVWVDTSTSPDTTKVRVGGAWLIGGNYTTNTNELTDGAGLGITATWSSVTGTDKPADNADVTNYSDTRISNSISESGVVTIRQPIGGNYTSNVVGLGSGRVEGAIVVTLPQSWTSTMMKMVVDVFNFSTPASAFTLHVGGYNYGAAGYERWINEFAQLIGSTASNNRVRFGHDGTKCCIVIGEALTDGTPSNWYYPKVSVRDFMAGYGGSATIAAWDDGWNVTIKNDLTGYSFTGNFDDSLLDARSILGQGALATSTLEEGQVTNTAITLNADGTISGAGGGTIDALQILNGPAQAGADVTGSNTSLDTTNVNGVPAATVQQNAQNALNAVNNMAADNVFSAQEKRQWQIQWPGMEANYTSIQTQATSYGLTGQTWYTTLTNAKTTLYNFLNTTHNVFAASPTDSALTGTLLVDYTTAYYSALSTAINELADYAHTAHGVAENATQNILYRSATAPTSPQTGDLWLNINTGLVQKYESGSWEDYATKNAIDNGFNIVSAVYHGRNFDPLSQDNTPRGLAFSDDGLKMFIAGDQNNNIYEYNLTTPYYINTASHSYTFDISSQSTIPNMIRFRPDGMGFYILDAFEVIYQYNMTTAWDLSTASYASKSKDVSSVGTNQIGMEINTDGTKIYTLNSADPWVIYEWDLSTAYDITTASYTAGHNLSTSSAPDPTTPTNEFPWHIEFNGNGTLLVVTNTANGTLYQYTLTTAWDITTATYNNRNISLAELVGGIRIFAYEQNGFKMYAGRGMSTDPKLYQYNLDIH